MRARMAVLLNNKPYIFLNSISIYFKNELNNKLMSITDNDAIKSMDVREDGVYMTYIPADGADPVSKKLGSLNFELNTSVDIYFSGADNIRQKINTNIKYTYKNGVLSHIVTSVSGGYGNSECRVSKNITIS